MPTIVDKLSVRKVCVDDFAITKRVSYGTVMVDLETHRIVDILPSRDAEDVKAWLATYPNIEVVSRDGSQVYASATRKAHPDVIQVSDRFHLMKGLSEAINRFVIREFPARIPISQVSVQTDEMKILLNVNNRAKRIAFAHKKKEEGLTVAEIAVILHASLKTVVKYLNIDPTTVKDKTIQREQQHLLSVQQKQNEVNEARHLAQQGVPVEQIAKKLHHGTATIKKYLNPNYSIENGHYHVRMQDKLAPYEKEVLELRSKGLTYPKIHEIICNKGYDGSVASLRMFVQKEQIRNIEAESKANNSDYFPKEFVQRKSISNLIYKKLEEVHTITQKQYEQVLKEYPMLAELYDIVQQFHKLFHTRSTKELVPFLERIEKLDITELNTFCNGIRIDLVAVKNAIKMEYNNGLAEGSVNKIKLIKRVMYGRNSFELLKAKILFYEQFRFEIN